MDWSYVAGFMDGEGWISQKKSASFGWQVAMCQSTPQDLCLREIQKFLVGQGIQSMIYIARYNGPRRRPVTRLNISTKRRNLVLFLNSILPFLIVKRQAAQRALESLYKPCPRKHASRPSADAEESAYALHWNEKRGLREAANLNHISPDTLSQYINRNLLPQHSKNVTIWMTRRRNLAFQTTI